MEKGKISTRKLDLMPDIDELKKICAKLALYESILIPDYAIMGYTYGGPDDPFIYWNFDDNGDKCLRIFFDEDGAIIIGFDSDSLIDGITDYSKGLWPGLVANVPYEFRQYVNVFWTDYNISSKWYPKYERDYGITYCIWKKYTDTSWKISDYEFPEGNSDGKLIDKAGRIVKYIDGSEEILYILDGKPETFIEWVDYRFEDEPLTTEFKTSRMKYLNHIYQFKPINLNFLKEMDPNLNDEYLKSYKHNILRLGYPWED